MRALAVAAAPTVEAAVPAVSPVPSGLLQRKCTACDEEESTLQRRRGPGSRDPDTVPDIVHDVLRGPGQPLDPGTRAFFEPRFGHDFSRVRVHTDARAAESARAVNAVAYTVGRDVVFGTGAFSPATTGGRTLIAHELAHTVQQQNGGTGLQALSIGPAAGAAESEADGAAQAIMAGRSISLGTSAPVSDLIQRACGPTAIGTPEGCTFSDETIDGPRYLFQVNCDEFARGNEDDLRADAMSIVDGETIEIHGIASIDGDADFNLHLSCARALRAKRVIESVLATRGVSATILVFNRGATPGDATLQRSVMVTRTAPAPPEPEVTRRCGPDATDWFVRQVEAAKSDPTILALQARLAGAERVARSGGFSAERVAEGAVAKRVLAEEARAGSPTRTTEASAQIAASVPGQREFGRALLAAPVPIAGRREALVLAAIRGAALTWKNLVGTGRKYDFKNRSETLGNPTSDNCPSDCGNTITMCPSTASDCFVKDVPGNLFYAHVGRFVGWTELSLQLGSQFAQLDASATWDPPEDTRMITFGFGLPDPLTRASLCSAIQANRSVFDLQTCSNCSEEVSADVV